MSLRLRDILYRVIFFTGWLLSPFTFWNDAFINIPLSYLFANLFIRLFPANFLLTVLVFYWMTNALGIVMMYLSGKEIVREKAKLIPEILKFLATIAIYTIILIVLGRAGLLRPI